MLPTSRSTAQKSSMPLSNRKLSLCPDQSCILRVTKTHLNTSMWHELSHLTNFLSTSPSVRAVLLSGSGPRAFTAGLDIQDSSTSGPLTASPNLDAARKATLLRRHILEFQACISALSACEKPIAAILHGHTLGLGIDIASAADVRFCAEGTRFCVKEVDIGIAADVGTLTRLPKVVGNQSWVNDVSLSARVFDASEALRVGFVSQVFKDKDDAVRGAIAWAKLVSEKSPVAVQGTKELLAFSRDRSVEDGLRYTAVWNSAMLQAADVQEAMGAGLRRKKARFEKL